MVTAAQLLQQRGITQRGMAGRSRAVAEAAQQRRIAQQQAAMKVPTGPTPIDYEARGKKQSTKLEKVIASKKGKVTLYKEQYQKALKKGKVRSMEAAEKRLIRAEETLSALEGMKGKALTGQYRYEDLVSAATATGIYHLQRETERAEFKAAQVKEAAEFEKARIGRVEEAGFKPVYYGGKLVGYEDPQAQMTIPVADFEGHIEAKYAKAPDVTSAMPLVAYKDIFTGKIITVPLGTSPAYGVHVPVAVSAVTGKELGIVEQWKLQAERPELFGREPTPVPEPSIILPEGYREVPKPAYIPDFGTAVSEEYPRTQIIPIELPSRSPVYKQILPAISYGVMATGKLAATAVPDFPGIKVAEARRVPAGWKEKPAYIPKFGTYIPPEQRIREWEEEKVYDPKYIFESKRVKEAVAFGVPLGVGLAAWQAIPAKLVAPAIAGVSAVEVAKAQKEIVELKEQKIDIKDIKAEITTLKADVGVRPVGVIDKDWKEYESEYLAEVEKYETEYLAEAKRYNKEIEEAIKSQRTAQAIGVAGVGLGAAIGAGQIVKYAKASLVKPLPYKVPKPKREEIQWLKFDPKTGKPITEGVYGIRMEIPARKELVQKRWEKWIGREPKSVDITKAKEKFIFTPEVLVEGVPGKVLETRAVTSETLRKFAIGEKALVLKEKIVGGVSAPATLSELKTLPKHQQRLWREFATKVQQGRTASLTRTPDILKKFQKTQSRTITYDPITKKIVVADVAVITKPVKEISKATEFGLIAREIPKDAPVEFFRAKELMKDITPSLGAMSRIELFKKRIKSIEERLKGLKGRKIDKVAEIARTKKVSELISMKKEWQEAIKAEQLGLPRAVGGIPEMDVTIARLKKIIGDEPSKIWGKTYPKVEKGPSLKVVTEMAPPKLLPSPLLPEIKVPTPKVVTALHEPLVVTKMAAPSVWAGTGLYERVDVGVMPGVRLDVPFMSMPEARVDVEFVPAQIIEPVFKPFVRVDVIPELKIELKPIVKPGVRIISITKPVVEIKPIVKPKVRIIPKVKMELRQVMKPITEPLVRPIARPVARLVVRPLPKPLKPTKPFKPIIILPRKKKPVRKPLVKIRPIRKKGYEVEVKRKGKWEDVTPYAISKGEALALGRIETKAGAEVSFRLKKTDGVQGSMGLIPISEIELRKEYRGKMIKGKEVKEPQTFIQKRKFRIATPKELLAITAKGIKKRRAKALGERRSKALGERREQVGEILIRKALMTEGHTGKVRAKKVKPKKKRMVKW